MDNLFKSFFIDNTPKLFDTEGQGPSQKDMGLVESPAGPSSPGAENQNATGPKPPEGDQIVASGEPRVIAPEAPLPNAEDQKASSEANKPKDSEQSKLQETGQRRASAKERGDAASTKSREVSRATTDAVKGLAKAMGREAGRYVNDKLDGAKDILLDKIDSIAYKAEKKKEAAIVNTRDAITSLASRAKDKLVTQPVDKVKGIGRGVKDYYKRGKDFVDRIKLDDAKASAAHYENKAARYEAKAVGTVDPILDVQARADKARLEGNTKKADRLEGRQDRISKKQEVIRARANRLRQKAQKSNESADKFRANMAGRK